MKDEKFNALKLALRDNPDVNSGSRKLMAAATEARLMDLVLGEGYSARDAAKILDISVRTVYEKIDAYTSNLKEFSERSVESWRMEQILMVDEQMRSIINDMNIQPYRETGVDGQELSSWALTPSAAGNIRNKSRKMFLEFIHHKARLLGLMVDKKEIDVNAKQVVVHTRGVNLALLGPDEDIIEGEVLEPVAD